MLKVFTDNSLFIWNLKYRSSADKTILDTFSRTSKGLGESEQEKKDFYDVMSQKWFMPGGRVLQAAGLDREFCTMMNCFLQPPPEDSMAGIYDNIKLGALTLRTGGGIGTCFDYLRPNGALVKGVQGKASGPEGFIPSWDAMGQSVEAGGNRRGAQMATMFIANPSIFNFIRLKRKQNPKDPDKIQCINLSVCISDEAIEMAKNNETITLFHWEKSDEKSSTRHIIIPEFHNHWGNPYHFISQKDVHSNDLVTFSWKDGNYKVVPYRDVLVKDIFDEIIEGMYASGEPGIIFIDTMNRRNNLYWAEDIMNTNPCGEANAGPYGCCDLGSVNLPQMVDPKTNTFMWDRFDHVLRIGLLMLARVSEKTKMPTPEYEEANILRKKIGLGLTGVADTLIMLGYKYGSKECIKFLDKLGEFWANTLYDEAVNLVKVFGIFPLFNKNKYLAGEWIQCLRPEVRERIAKEGIAFSSVMAIAPTGTISMLMDNVSPGVEPIYRTSFSRVIKVDANYDYLISLKDGDEYMVTEEELKSFDKDQISSKIEIKLRPSQDNKWLYSVTLKDWLAENHPEYLDTPAYTTAKEVSVQDHLAVQSALQKWVDMSISKTITLVENASRDDIKNLIFDAHKKLLKGLTVYRDKTRDGVLKETGSAEEDDKKTEDLKEKLKNAEMRIKELEKIMNPDAQIDPPDKMSENRWRFDFGDRKAYVSCGPIGAKQPKEVRIQVGKSGSFECGLCEALGRVISVSLQRGVPVEALFKTLNGINSGNTIFFGKFSEKQKKPIAVTSIAHAIAQILYYNYMNVDEEKVLEGKPCPKCHKNSVINSDGCPKCTECGWARCGS